MRELRDLYIMGAGGFGREVAWLVRRINRKKPTWNLCGFIDDNKLLHGTSEDGYLVLGGCDYFEEISKESWLVLCAVGSAKARLTLIEKVKRYSGVKFATLIDPDVKYSEHTAIGEGSIICAGTILTVNVSVGKYVIINLDCTVGHDAVIDDFVTVYPSVNISGNVTVETCAELGTGAVIIQGKKIGNESIIGAGAVVVRDIQKKCTAVGNPAKPIKFF